MKMASLMKINVRLNYILQWEGWELQRPFQGNCYFNANVPDENDFLQNSVINVSSVPPITRFLIY